MRPKKLLLCGKCHRLAMIEYYNGRLWGFEFGSDMYDGTWEKKHTNYWDCIKFNLKTQKITMPLEQAKLFDR